MTGFWLGFIGGGILVTAFGVLVAGDEIRRLRQTLEHLDRRREARRQQSLDAARHYVHKNGLVSGEKKL
ncbi:MAG TPA: hypothetical protein VFJ52_01790 [Terriglobia bacterium]|nr:hypothetical protein [Terriglobia bacterium]